MANAKYAYFIPEGAGYLQVRYLGDGTQGVAWLVRSVADGKLYVRKITRTTDDSANVDDACKEDGQTPRDGEAVAFTSMIWKFCNGGDLLSFNTCFDKDQNRIPESVIWRCFSQLLCTIEYLHRRCKPIIIHCDIGCGNIFLHWQNPDSRVPDFYLGDFGYAETLASLSPPSDDGEDDDLAHDHGERIQDLIQDLDYLGVTVVGMVTLEDEEYAEAWEDNIDKIRDDNRQHYSGEIFNCLEHLRQLKDILVNHIDHYFLSLSQLKDHVKARASVFEANHPGDVSFTRPVYQNVPVMFASRNMLLGSPSKPMGPWRVARVDPETFRVLSVEIDLRQQQSTPPALGHPAANTPHLYVTNPTELPADVGSASPDGFPLDPKWDEQALYGGIYQG